jgi:hypothetical protein
MFVPLIMKKIDCSSSIVQAQAIAGAQPHIAAAILKKMVYNILRQTILYIQMLEIIIGIEFLTVG